MRHRWTTRRAAGGSRQPRPFAAAAMICLFIAGCGEREKPSAEKDLERQTGHLMDEMDRIAAEEEQKQKAADAQAPKQEPDPVPEGDGSTRPPPGKPEKSPSEEPAERPG